MDIENRTILVLGGGGLVGSAICRKLVAEKPKRIIVTSLFRAESEETVATLRREFPGHRKQFFTPWWGNIFVRHDLKDTPRAEILSNAATRQMLIEDMLEELTEPVLERSTIFRLVQDVKPDIIIDCINSATAIAYQDIFQSARSVIKEMRKPASPPPQARQQQPAGAGRGKGGGRQARAAQREEEGQSPLREAVEHLLCTLYTPQLIRHVQILYRSMHASGTTIYVKIGTSGTGGMGLNIPYTHSEERPSSVLLSKSAVAGAHTLLLFLMGRTPDAPITKEIKPAAAIAWKRVGYGEIRKRGKPIQLFDCPPSRATRLGGTLELRPERDAAIEPTGDTLRSVFIDTGENGLFSRGEFEAIATPGQMEFVTPEEIAESAIYEIKGGNTGHDIINALDNASLAPTYRAGYLFQHAQEEIRKLEEEHGVRSVAFEMLGPPRLSKLLYEAYLLKVCFGDMLTVLRTDPAAMSRKLCARIHDDAPLRAQIISIGIPILLPDGVSLLRANEIKIPPSQGDNHVRVSPRSIDLWCHDGWVDLRVANMKRWKARFRLIRAMVSAIPPNDSSSRHLYTSGYWSDFRDVDPGKLAGWIFNYEERGMRMKA